MREGMSVKSFLPAGAPVMYEVGKDGIVRIDVTVANGQMAHVPWLRVSYGDGRSELWNCAHLAMVEPTPWPAEPQE